MGDRVSRFVENVLVSAITPTIIAIFALVFGVVQDNLGISLQIVVIVILIYNTIILMRQNSERSRQALSPGSFVSDGKNSYLIDVHGRARLIRDQATRIYLMGILGSKVGPQDSVDW